MKIIEKIEIKHFRSFIGSPAAFKVEIDSLTDLNIFSGANDSGKSNILRALNVFFNNKVDIHTEFDFDRDFSLGKINSKHKVIEIGLKFNLSKDPDRDKFLPEKFTITKYYDRNGFRNSVYTFNLQGRTIKIDSRTEHNKSIKDIFITKDSTSIQKRNAEKREWIYRVKFLGFLNQSVMYEYVPAIRDKNFYTQMFGRIISELKNSEDINSNKISKRIQQVENWTKTINLKVISSEYKSNLQKKVWREEELKSLKRKKLEGNELNGVLQSLEAKVNQYSKELMKSIDFLESEFKIGKDLQDFFEGFDIGTGDNKSISFRLRGDGIQSKFVTKMLNFLSTLSIKNKYYIWGIEEPENSLEYKNQRELAKLFKEEFSRKKQMFITTHSNEFLSVYDGNEIPILERKATLYGVKKLQTKGIEHSKVYRYDPDRYVFEFADGVNQIHDDLGYSSLRYRYSKQLLENEQNFIDKIKKLEEKGEQLELELLRSQKPILFVEDSYAQLYKIAWLKLNNKSFSIDNMDRIFDIESKFVIFRAEGADKLAGFLRTTSFDLISGRNVIGLFDFDKKGVDQFCNLNNNEFWKKDIEGNKKIGLLKRRKDHKCFCSMLIPIPERLSSIADIDFPSYVEIENLINFEYLKDRDLVKENTTTGNTKYYSFKEDQKSEFWKDLITQGKEIFEDFEPLFKRVEQIFKLSDKKL